ncbi:MAG: AIR synthase-related protein, partial [Thermoanaerobaculia bacterium]
ASTVLDEAVRRQLCAGARLDRIAALDNFCWPDPVRSETTPDGEYKLAQLVRACRGLHEICLAYGVPLISGKDSMKNESTMGGVKISVPPTLLLSAIGQIDDVREALTLDLKQPGDVVYVLGETGPHTGASEYFRYLGDRKGLRPELGQPAPFVGRRPPTVDTTRTVPLYTALHGAIRAGLLRSASTPNKGGLAVSLARCALAADLGLAIDLDDCPGVDWLEDDIALFSESNGRFVVSLAADQTEEFERHMEGTAWCRAGVVTEEPRLVIRRDGRSLVDADLNSLRSRFKEGLEHA